ncbi:MAG: hypothetical protein IKN69_01960 [Bacilli bacterium]|nr:hypothetical protein [Bacilli bacterium]
MPTPNPILIAVLIALGVIILGVLIFLLVKIFGKKRLKSLPIASKSEYFDALGGEDNYIDSSREGSRIIVHLKDYSKINKEKIKEAGVTGFIEKSDKLTLVVKDNAEEVYEKIFNA